MNIIFSFRFRLLVLLIFIFIPLFVSQRVSAQETQPYLDITSPVDNIYAYGSVKLDAYIYGGESDTVEWGVFKDTCHSGNLAAGNIQGKSDYYNYIWLGDRHRFEIPLTISDWEAGRYCFAIHQIYLGTTPQNWYERSFNIIDIQVSPTTQTVLVGETAYIKIKIIPAIENLDLLVISTGINNFTDLNFSFGVNGETDVPLVSTNYGTDHVIGCADFNDNQECDWGSGDIWNSATIVWYINRVLDIESPVNNTIYFNDVPIKATFIGERNDSIEYEIRKDDCSGQLISNQIASSYTFSFDSENNSFKFDSLLGYEGLSPGKYCLNINPIESSGSQDTKDSIIFYLGDFEASVGTISNPVGQQTTISASLGAPIENQKIIFEVTGANPSYGQSQTDSNGEANYSYTGHNPGTDNISACFDENDDNSCQSDEETINLQSDWYTLENPIIPGIFSGSGNLKLKKYEGGLNTYDYLSHISYAGQFESDSSGFKGNISLIFHKDTKNTFISETIKLKEFEEMAFRIFSCNGNQKSAYFKAKADKLGSGYTIEFFATDLGKNEKYDLVRIKVYNANDNIIYDTFDEGFEYYTHLTCILNPSDQFKSISSTGYIQIR